MTITIEIYWIVLDIAKKKESKKIQILKNSKRYKFFIKKSKDSELINYRQKKKKKKIIYVTT